MNPSSTAESVRESSDRTLVRFSPEELKKDMHARVRFIRAMREDPKGLKIVAEISDGVREIANTTGREQEAALTNISDLLAATGIQLEVANDDVGGTGGEHVPADDHEGWGARRVPPEFPVPVLVQTELVGPRRAEPRFDAPSISEMSAPDTDPVADPKEKFLADMKAQLSEPPKTEAPAQEAAEPSADAVREDIRGKVEKIRDSDTPGRMEANRINVPGGPGRKYIKALDTALSALASPDTDVKSLRQYYRDLEEARDAFSGIRSTHQSEEASLVSENRPSSPVALAAEAALPEVETAPQTGVAPVMDMPRWDTAVPPDAPIATNDIYREPTGAAPIVSETPATDVEPLPVLSETIEGGELTREEFEAMENVLQKL